MSTRLTEQVLTRKFGDVTGDGVADEIFLVGDVSEDSAFIQNITLFIRNGRTTRVTQVPLQDNAGFEPTLFLCDFTGDGILDIKVSIQSGGSGGFVFTYIYSFVDNRVRLLFDGESYSNSKQFRAFYDDGFVVVVVDEGLGLTFRIDVSADPAAQDLYDENGNLKQPTEANVSPFILAYPIVLDEEAGTCSLLALTRVFGLFAADTLGFVQDFLSWNGRRFETFREDLAIRPSADPD